MKRIIIIAAALALTACASQRNATIEDGKVSNITSAEATTLMLGEQRRAKVQDVQTNQKPIFQVTAKAGEDIVFKGVASIEINVPLDLNILMAERQSETSENVQVLREVRGIFKETVTPIGLGAILLNDRNNQRQSNERITESNNARAAAADAEDAASNQAMLDALSASQQATIDALGAAAAAAP